jgi:hypothetical protein
MGDNQTGMVVSNELQLASEVLAKYPDQPDKPSVRLARALLERTKMIERQTLRGDSYRDSLKAEEQWAAQLEAERASLRAALAAMTERAENAETSLKAPEVHWECKQEIEQLHESLRFAETVRDDARAASARDLERCRAAETSLLMPTYLVTIQDKSLYGEPDVAIAIVEAVDEATAWRAADATIRELADKGRGRCVPHARVIDLGRFYRLGAVVRLPPLPKEDI